MTYDIEKATIGREHFYIVEIDLDYCSLSSGVAPCTATQTGDAKCYNTLASCNDIPNYTKTTKTYRFCESRSPHPIGLDAIPCLASVGISAAKTDIKGGLGVRAGLSLAFNDFPNNDVGIDKYATERTFIASERGSYWSKLRARNTNYKFKEVRLLSGYIVDGVYNAANFRTSYFVIEKLDVSNGQATITAKDPLKKADKNKGQAPKASTGLSQSALTTSSTTITLTPTGVGNSEYPASGFVAMKSEVMSFTRSGDVLTVVRAQKNTVAVAHSVNDTVQLCLEYNAQINTIVKDLLTTYLDFNPAFISDTAWQSEVDTYLNGLYYAIITKPTDVNKLLKELAESAPHYLWWNEHTQLLELTVLKPPPTGSIVLNMDDHLVKDTVAVRDQNKMRVSTVFINFGQYDPTKKLDEPNNYQQTYVRVDTDSITKYESSTVKVIYSRWISNTNKAGALRSAALIGRRFSDVPREISFALDPKDSDVWLGQSRAINYRDIVDFSGQPVDTVFQIISAKEDKLYRYLALEYAYGQALPEDEGGGDPTVDLIVLDANYLNINLRTVYDSQFPAPSASTKVKVIIGAGAKIGGSVLGGISLDTGSFPTGATLELINNGFIVGRGGDGRDRSGIDPNLPEAGSTALKLNHPISLNNQGVIGGGGGGGQNDGDGNNGEVGGGGGAGFNRLSGISGGFHGGYSDYFGSDPNVIIINAANGGLEIGGVGGEIHDSNADLVGGAGGNLGAVGGGAGGTAGKAIEKNGKTLTYINAGDIRGVIV